ncbi:MAG: hypothetical protein RLZZ297_909 [Chloroflexota bacterium]
MVWLTVGMLIACGSTPTPAPVVPTLDAGGLIPTPAVPGSSDSQLASLGNFPRIDEVEFGVVEHLYYTDRNRVLTLTEIAGFDWIRQQIHWKDIEASPGVYYWDEVDRIIADTSAFDVKIMISVVQAPDFYEKNHGIPSDPRPFGAFVENMIQRYGGLITAVEVWNEPNLAVENGGSVDDEAVAHYAEMLMEAYRRIKAVRAYTYVIAAAPSSTGVDDVNLAMNDTKFLTKLYAYKGGAVKDFFDAQGVHPGAAANPPDTMYPDKMGNPIGWNDHPTHYFRHVENVRKTMVDSGLAEKQIWLTEYGWATANTSPGYEYGNEVTMEEQAQYIGDATEMVYRTYRDEVGRSWIGVMFLWNMNFAVLWGEQGNPLHEQAAYGILNPDWSPRPAFIALQGIHMRIKEEQGKQ